jgi:protein-tyrosine phosphatase
VLRLCFVCLGNICRSPTAEGIMLHLVREAGLSERFLVDSAGTAAYHVGERADPRSIQAAKARGVELPSVARAFTVRDFERFDLVLAMDEQNQKNLLVLAPTQDARAKVKLLRCFDPKLSEGSPVGSLSVPDPYYGGPEGFREVFDICHAACQGLLSELRREHAL